jgi:diguanylate cyclase (GGDEF)-like protein/PAS domain S-box-containing protein
MRKIRSLIELLTDDSEAALRGQYASMLRQIPLMYLLMSINVAFLAIVPNRDMSLLSLGVPLSLSFGLGIRAYVWIARRNREVTLQQIRRQLLGTIGMAAIFSVLLGAWGLALFAEADPVRSTSVALYVFVGSITCCYCLQALPIAAWLVLLFGAMPVTVRLLISQDWYLFGIGVTFLLVAAVILQTLKATRLAFAEILRSRSELASLLAALQKSEEHHRYSMELNAQIPWTADPFGKIVEMSPRWTALTGHPAGEALGDSWTLCVHPDDLPGLLDLWNKALETGGTSVADSRYRLCLADGSYRWMRARAWPRRDHEGRILLWYGSLEDIDDQVAAELALRDSEERYRLAARATDDIIWDWSPDTRRISWAEGTESIFGYPVASGGTPLDWWLERVHPDDLPEIMDLFTSVAASGADSWSHEYRLRAADGAYLDILARGYLVRGNQGGTIRAIGAIQDITTAKRIGDDLRWAAYHDSLTGLPNRKMFSEQLARALATAGEASSCVGVIVFDIDGFKSINDRLGHAAGDLVLKTIARRIGANLPTAATLARLGGDEYAIILPGLAREDAGVATVGSIIGGAQEAIAIGESAVDVCVSAGAAMWPMDGTSAEDVLKSADLALYAAKAEGSGAVRVFHPAMRDARECRDRMLRDARDALRDDRIMPYYQPKISFVSGRIIGFEALLRWHDHQRGVQSPQTLKAAFEDAVISTQLTDRMIDRVLADMRGWLDEGRSFGRIAINASPADFRRDDFAERILTRLRQVGLAPTLLELEVTETVFLEQEAANVDRALHMLAAEGVTIALDDFGTGYASLTHLQQFPVDVLKIDRSFVSRLGSTDSGDLAIVAGVIDIAHKMKIETVAEGVENEVQAGHLRALGCDIAQGFLFSPPASASHAGSLMDNWLRSSDATP